MKAIPGTCGFCRYFGACTTKHKDVTCTKRKCKFYEPLPESTKVTDLVETIGSMSFCEINQIRKLLNASIIDIAQKSLRVGQIVGFSAGETKGWVEGRIIKFEGDKVYLQDTSGTVWSVFPGFIDVMLKSEVDEQPASQGG